MTKKLLLWLDAIDQEDMHLVGEKALILASFLRAKLPVPSGFVITTDAYREFLKANALETKIKHLFGTADISNRKSLEKVGSQIKKELQKSTIPESIVTAIFRAYFSLGEVLKNPSVKIFSTFVDEQKSHSSMQQPLLLEGEANLMSAIKDIWSSLFDIDVLLRCTTNDTLFSTAASITVQKFVEPEVSGTILTINPAINDKTTAIIEAVYGVEDLSSQRKIPPDIYEIHKTTGTITKKHISEQTEMIIYKDLEEKTVRVLPHKQAVQKISDSDIKDLAALALRVEKLYYFPQEISWAMQQGSLHIVDTKRITSLSLSGNSDLRGMSNQKTPLFTGDIASQGIATGPVKVLEDIKHLHTIVQGDILVVKESSPQLFLALKRASAVICEQPGIRSHLALFARDMGIPALVGVKKATELLKNGDIITVNAITGTVYQGGYPNAVDEAYTPTNSSFLTATKLYVDLSSNEKIQTIAKEHIDGVGMFRGDAMLQRIGVHPKKLIADGNAKEFVKKAAEEIASVCKVFSPRPVIYHFSSMQTDKLRLLQGGNAFESVESNPLIGFRGAYRDISDIQMIALELEIINLVRNTMGLHNLWCMLPLVRTVKEVTEIMNMLSSQNLYRSPTFQVWLSCQNPAIVMLLDKYLESGIDGVAIDSTALTSLILGADLKNQEIMHAYTIQNDAALWAYQHVITTCHRYHIASTFLSGQSLPAPLLEKLVSWGVTSITIPKEHIGMTRQEIVRVEKDLMNK